MNVFYSFRHGSRDDSRDYAKRQFTCFRKEPLFRWLDVDLHDHEVAFDIIQKDSEAI